MSLEKNNIKNCFFITLCNGEMGQKEKIETELCSILQQKPNEVKELWINNLLPEDKQNKIKHTFNFKVSKNDLENFNKDIEVFVRNITGCNSIIN